LGPDGIIFGSFHTFAFVFSAEERGEEAPLAGNLVELRRFTVAEEDLEDLRRLTFTEERRDEALLTEDLEDLRRFLVRLAALRFDDRDVE